MSVDEEKTFRAKCSFQPHDRAYAWAGKGRIEVRTECGYDSGPNVYLTPDDAEAFGHWLIARAKELRSL